MLATVLSAALLAGCWGHREISELALVMAVGIDRTEAGRVRVTVQIARPGGATGSGSAGGVSGGGGPPVYIAAAEGRSIFEAIRNLALFSSRRIMWAHNQVIVVGESQARAGVNEVVDFFIRNPELRFRTLVTLAAGEARDIVSENTGMETHPASSIAKTFRYATIIGEARQVDMKEFAASHLDAAVSPVLPLLRRAPRLVPGTANKESDPQEVLAQGMGVFREGRLAAILNQQESRGVAMLRGEPGRIVITLPCPGQGAGAPVALELLSKKSRIRPRASEPGQLAFDIHLAVQAGISALACDLEYREPQNLRQLERSLAESLTRDIRAALEQARATATDPFGMGQILRARLPDRWAAVAEGWPEPMAGAGFTVQVTARIKGGELSLLPTGPRKERGQAD